MSEADWIVAGRLALPADARLTGATRLRQLGIDAPPGRLQFVVGRDLHLDLDGIDLHRTDSLPPCTDEGVSPAAAFIELCRYATVLAAIRVGDELLRRGHMTLIELRELVRAEAWRGGAAQAGWVSRYLDPRSMSPQESTCRAHIVFAGLPWPAVNVEIRVDGVLVAVLDLGFRTWNAAAEYEGGHHQVERSQYLRDIGRYGDLREMGVEYVQITKELARTPIRMVMAVHTMLVRCGYDGPPPDFGAVWRQLDEPIPASIPGPVHRSSGGSASVWCFNRASNGR